MDMLLLLMTIDKEECQTVNTQKDDSYHKISHTTHIGRDLRSLGQGQGPLSMPRPRTSIPRPRTWATRPRPRTWILALRTKAKD